MKTSTLFKPSLIAAACIAVTACGGGGSSNDTVTGSAADDTKTALAIGGGATTVLADGREITLRMVSETRVSRTVYDYVYTIVLKNNATALTNGMAALTGAGAGTTVVSGLVPIGELAANDTVEPHGTIKLRHDRAQPFNAAALVWSITNSTAALNRTTVPADVATAASKIANDPQIAALLTEQRTPEMAKKRWNNFLELVRIPSPSREEYRSVAEIHRRLVTDFGFDPSDITTRNDGFLPGTDVNIVDGLPVYNACVRIKGSYSSRPDAQSYKGEFPKVILEGHIDVVNPETQPPASDPWNHIKLQPYAQPIVETPVQLAAIPEELSFDSNGRVIENTNYNIASQWFTNATTAANGGGVRIYVPGYGDMMSSTTNAFILAAGMKKHNIRPVYDVWICGTAGEEGKGNLAGMKQLYGFEQDLGTGSNPLNVVANFGLEGGGILNFLGSYRFEMKFSAPTNPGPTQPSAVEAMAAAIARISDVKTPSELRPGAPRTTYTVGRASCEPIPAGSSVVPSCSLEVDMRSPVTETLNEIRDVIQPMFKAGQDAENARYGLVSGAANAVSMAQVWYGLRPAYVAESYDSPATHAGIQSGIATGQSTSLNVGTGSGSLNDNVPANTGIPTYQFSLSSNASGGGGHAFWEWGTRGDPANEVSRMHRVLTAVLTVSGFHAADGTIVQPSTGPIGRRTREAAR
ncbi:peptidase dimerization domain-containing protein [Piscinibacter koreensis]|uniref:Peptidase dimerization domain-containing protein n=1 Tax=Piscinibacter koreensis TaxID=2742824 RepID=A0A7Y6TZH1_9BURK|nr:peptidase dimerization domain-containing protein [Schlegelella koreensis]NUZ09140.1 peptidase dimerization domain-containing protein [Schlegelella koreensis]